jgi:hypothetical protein
MTPSLARKIFDLEKSIEEHPKYVHFCMLEWDRIDTYAHMHLRHTCMPIDITVRRISPKVALHSKPHKKTCHFACPSSSMIDLRMQNTQITQDFRLLFHPNRLVEKINKGLSACPIYRQVNQPLCHMQMLAIQCFFYLMVF